MSFVKKDSSTIKTKTICANHAERIRTTPIEVRGNASVVLLTANQSHLQLKAKKNVYASLNTLETVKVNVSRVKLTQNVQDLIKSP